MMLDILGGANGIVFKDRNIKAQGMGAIVLKAVTSAHTIPV